MTSNDLLSQAEVLKGLSGDRIKRSNVLVRLIENQTAYLLRQAKQPLTIQLTGSTHELRTEAYFEALTLERERTAKPTAQDIERYAKDWAVLIPENAQMQATVAHLLGEKYALVYRSIPGIRNALGLDTESVQHAYHDLFEQTIEAVYEPRVGPFERLRWAWASLARWIDNLPVFWTAFAVALIIGGVTFALPVAAAGIGVIPSIVLMVIIGLINMVTIAAMAETMTRSGSLRYGNAIMGRLVEDYLGPFGSAILSIMLTAFSVGLLLIFYLGISSTLEGSTGIPAEAWMVVLFLIGLYFLSRGSLNSTVAVTMIIAAVNLILMLVLIGISLTHLNVDNLLYVNVPLFNGQSLNLTPLSFIVGVILDTYAAHMMVTLFGKTLLQRDPSGRSVVRGHVIGIACTMVLNILWVIAVNGAVAPEVLASQTGTALVPLIEQIGPSIGVLGAIFAVLSMGLALIQFSLALFNLVKERLNATHVQKLGRLGTFMVSLIPVAAVFLVAEGMAITEAGSFAGLLAVLGVLVDSLVAGTFPVLLLIASRRKGDLVPQSISRFLGNPVLLTVIYAFFWLNIVVHGVFIWQGVVERIGAVLLALLMLWVTIRAIRQGAFSARTVVELRDDQRADGESHVAVVAAGKPHTAALSMQFAQAAQTAQSDSLRVDTFEGLRHVRIDLPPTKELKIWAHQITVEGVNVELPVQGIVQLDGEKQAFQSSGQIVLDTDSPISQVEIALPESSST